MRKSRKLDKDLPETTDSRDSTEKNALIAAVAEAEKNIRENRMVSNEEMKSRLVAWSIK